MEAQGVLGLRSAITVRWEDMNLGRDTYSGGGSILRIGENGGLEWTSTDPAETRTDHGPKPRRQNRGPSRKEIERQAAQDEIEEAKRIRSFISQCATAYAEKKLSASLPEPPKFLQKRIRKVGGNIAWLEADPRKQTLFHKAYCRLIGKEIPIEKVWSQGRVKA